jgi:hypothetical protein
MIYIGMSKAAIGKRWEQHVKNSKKMINPLYVAMRADGIENFKLETLEVISYKNYFSSEIWWAEQYYMQFYRSYEPAVGYNKIDDFEIGR